MRLTRLSHAGARPRRLTRLTWGLGTATLIGAFLASTAACINPFGPTSQYCDGIESAQQRADENFHALGCSDGQGGVCGEYEAQINQYQSNYSASGCIDLFLAGG